MRHLGIAVGASRVKTVLLSEDRRVDGFGILEHVGDPRARLTDMLGRVPAAGVGGYAVTGREGCSMIGGRRVYESEAVEEALRFIGARPNLVVSLGGESFIVYPIGSNGEVLDCVSGNRCAAGTAEFFKQQLRRMGLSLEEALALAPEGHIVPLARRCSVHCKSDCTHALNKKNCSIADIVRTLCHNMAEKISALVVSTGFKGGNIVAIGGVTANRFVVGHLKELLPSFQIAVPAEAPYFEALGAACVAARGEGTPPPAEWAHAFRKQTSSFKFLPPLADFAGQVTFLSRPRETARPGRTYLLGVDGGSTTTKVALVDMETLAICGSHYTRTNGNPEQALRECLLELKKQVPDGLAIGGVGTTGSSGEILSVLCGTPWHHNEIIAHACGATHFCPEADTLFEIGGQDAKFTSLKSRVAIDFNMNESCSAGTGSFIEETAREDLGVPMEEIAGLALESRRPPRFSDQCAAFANTDTRKAAQEGATREDNLAGLIYSIVENYLSKVVGRRKIGDHILFQGGTSRNRAIAMAFASKTGKRIVVPPESELMGCFGIALWLREKLLSGEAQAGRFTLDGLLAARVEAASEFTCKACDNFCAVRNLTIAGKAHPFGGQCSRWENARRNRPIAATELDLVAVRNRMLFHDHAAPAEGARSDLPVIGLQAVFSVCGFYPLYSWFFHGLGHRVRLSEKVERAGVAKCQSARCYPYEICHGTFQDLIDSGVKHIFAPHLVAMPGESRRDHASVCPIAQAAPYYLTAAFGNTGVTMLDPVLNMENGIESAERAFVKTGLSLGHAEAACRRSFREACRKQHDFWNAARKAGAEAIEKLKRENALGIVLIGRPYNAFAKIANMGVPRKFASGGVTIIPCDFLPFEDEHCEDSMYWKYGRMILKAFRYVRRHENLFAVYISNYGCGPDSFIQHFAGDIMGDKPYLYLELDSHTADAGMTTRTAAFLDIIGGYRRTPTVERADERAFQPAEFIMKGKRACIRTSSGEVIPAKDKRVTLVFPSMGKHNTEALAAVSRRYGFRSMAMPPADERVMALGREFTSGKECIPAIITVGSLMDYVRHRFKKERPDEVLLFFMPTAMGPCRFGQYNVFMKLLIREHRLDDVVLFSLSAEDGYAGMGSSFMLTAWQAILIGGALFDIRSALNVAATDKAGALEVFEQEWRTILEALSRGERRTWSALAAAAERLRRIPLKAKPADIPKVLLAGEIFVRCDELSCRDIAEYYADEGIILKRADVSEWVYYTDWLYLNKLAGRRGYPNNFLSKRFLLRKIGHAFAGRPHGSRFVKARLKFAIQRRVDRRVQRILGRTGLLLNGAHHIDHMVRAGAEFVSPALEGEAILSAGSAKVFMEQGNADRYCGVVFIGPFNCMPTGVAEALTKPYARRQGIPYLTFETDGGPMPPNFIKQLEVHLLRARRYAKQNPAVS